MSDFQRRALHQAFLPTDRAQRAFVWKYSQSIGGRRPRHFHAEPELNLVVRGSAVFGLGDRVVRVSQGELLAFPTGQDHVLLDASPDLYLYAIGLDPAYSAEVLRVERGTLVPLHARLAAHELAPVLDRAASIVDRSGADELGAALWERAHWVGLHAVQAGSRATHVLTRRALQTLSASPELGLDALASQLRAPPSEISRHFHRDVGVTLVRYRMRLRVLHLIRLVDAGQHDLMTSASIAGFGSYSQCHRTFQSELGCGPRQFFSGLREQMQLTYSR
jgi:AraC-like DNA-binding protein/mannose-6-phosphate isomerase-like protein (cupin superfamily)